MNPIDANVIRGLWELLKIICVGLLVVAGSIDAHGSAFILVTLIGPWSWKPPGF